MNAPIPPPNNPYDPYNSQNQQPNPAGWQTAEEKNWAVVAHLSAFLSGILFILVLLVPLGIWLMKKDTSAFVANQAKEALNFQISLWIWGILAAVAIVSVVLFLVGIIIAIGIALAAIICPILAAIQVSNGQAYRYPLTFRLIS